MSVARVARKSPAYVRASTAGWRSVGSPQCGDDRARGMPARRFSSHHVLTLFRSRPSLHLANNFLFSVILAGRHTRTLPIAVFNMISYEEISWGPLAAAATMITLPVIILTLIVQRHIVSGLTFGAVKR